MSDPISLEDRMEAVKAWMLDERAIVETTDDLPRRVARDLAEIDLHLATLDDAIEALGFEKVVGKQGFTRRGFSIALELGF